MKLRSAKNVTTSKKISGVQLEQRTGIRKKGLSRNEARKEATLSRKEKQIHDKRSSHGSRKQNAGEQGVLLKHSLPHRFRHSSITGLKSLASPVDSRPYHAHTETHSVPEKLAERTNRKRGTGHLHTSIPFLATRASEDSSSSNKNEKDASGHASNSCSSTSSIEMKTGNNSSRRVNRKPCNSGSCNEHEEYNGEFDWDIVTKCDDADNQESRQKPQVEKRTGRKEQQKTSRQLSQQPEGGKQRESQKNTFSQPSPRFLDGDSDMEWSWSDKEDSCSSEESGEEAGGWKENADLRAVKKSWRRCCNRLNPDLLVRTQESIMECKHLSARKAGEPGYAAFPVNESNNCDLRRIYEVRFAPAKGRGHPIAAYSNIKSTFGQFSRLCVCLQLLDIRDVWKPGAIFRHILSKDAVFTFIAYFRLRGQATTVSNKAANLKTVVEHAGLYYAAQSDMESRARADELRISLDRARSAERREIRRIARNTKEEREAAGKLLDESDMDSFAERAYAACRGILKSAKECKPARDLFTSSPSGSSLISKWCINFLSFLMMVGNGQRPQVYRMLLLPTPEQMRSWMEDSGREVSLRTLLEKTPRNMECPAVLFPRSSASLLKFHVLVVRPLIMERLKIYEPGDRSEYPLLVHTKTGRMLRTGDVRGTLRAFLTRYDPELSGITPMILRSSFASTMFARFKRGELGEEKSVESFLADLAKLMNTSAEMLMANYIASNPLDFPKTVLTLFRAFQRSEACVEEDDGIAGICNMRPKTATTALLPSSTAAARTSQLAAAAAAASTAE
jgi:hypothetical protein